MGSQTLGIHGIRDLKGPGTQEVGTSELGTSDSSASFGEVYDYHVMTWTFREKVVGTLWFFCVLRSCFDSSPLEAPA